MRTRLELLTCAAILLISGFLPIIAGETHVQGLAPPGYQTYSVATIGGPRTLDPHRAYDTASDFMIFNVYDTLIEQDKGAVDRFIPELADSWTISLDGLTYTFHIRTGATFQDGNPVDPIDVEYSFERAMVRDISDGPIRMLNVPLLDLMSTRDWPGVLDLNPAVNHPARIALGQAIENAVTRDDGARTVTFHLLKPEGFFMQVLAQTLGSILDRAWMIRAYTFLGGADDTFDWPDNWGTNGYEWWQFNNLAREIQYTYMGAKTSPFDDPPQMMGSGPFTFVAWIKGVGGFRILARYLGYWGGWPAGAVGTARAGRYPIPSRGYIDTYIEYQIPTWVTRLVGFTASSPIYDTVDVPNPNIAMVWQSPGIRCRYPLGGLGVNALFFNFNTSDGISGLSPYVGTETWGTGLPLNAFSNPNLRKAFAYSFNQSDVLAQQFLYEAFLVATPIIPGLAPFTREELISYHQANRKNIDLTKAEYYFKLAWGGIDSRSGTPDEPVLPEDPTYVTTPGTVWTQGFSFYMTYDSGNAAGQMSASMLSAQLSAINPLFIMNSVEVDSLYFTGDYLHNPASNDRSIMPLWIMGWSADYADADDAVTSFMATYGDFSYSQSYGNSTIDTLIDEARSTSDVATRKTKYSQLNDIHVYDLPQIMGMVPSGRRWERDWVQGWYYNPSFPGTNLYTLWKEQLPWEDVDANGRIEIKDLATGAKAYGSYFFAKLPPLFPTRIVDTLLTWWCDNGYPPNFGVGLRPAGPLDRYYDANQNLMWDIGEPAIKDVNNNNAFDSGDVVLVGPTPPIGAFLSKPSSRDRHYDPGLNGIWDAGEAAVRDSNCNYIYDSGDFVLVTKYYPTQDGVPLKLPGSLDKYYDANVNGVWDREDPDEAAVYDVDNDNIFDGIDFVLAGLPPPLGSALNMPGALDKYYDSNASGQWDLGETAIRDENNDNLFWSPYLPIIWGTYTKTWDSRADINQDMRVDIKDLAMMAKLFGWQAPGWP